jgi:hypothetical protein
MTYVPGVANQLAKRRTSGTASAKYCYEVWLKHLTMLWESGMRVIPDALAELGPGSSLGIGLAALLSGVRRYYALDVVGYANTECNLIVLDQLVDFFNKRLGRPSKGWPDYDQYLDSNLFPGHILTNRVLDAALTKERIESIRHALLNTSDEGSIIKYVVPWNESHSIREESVDVILSHSVLEHVTELEQTYNACSLWLRPNGWMSHQIDLRSHHLTKAWNGHWVYPEWLWEIIVGKRPYLINRQPFSRHVELLKESGFELVCKLKRHDTGGIERSHLASCWKNLSEDDFTCSGTFIQARKSKTQKKTVAWDTGH